MNRILPFLLAVTIVAACNTEPKTFLHSTKNVSGTVFGDSITDANVFDLATMSAAMKNETKKDMKIRGIVNEVCQKKGCWMTMKLSNGDNMRVTFKDYKIFVPKDLSGKEVVLEGFAYADTTSVENLQHYAEDAGKSKSEIAKITTPKKQLAFEAKGVVVMN